MSRIHPSSIIGAGAQIDDQVEIGPFSVVEPGAVIGQGTRLQGHNLITSAARIGQNNRIGWGTVIGAEPQDLAFDPTAQSYACIGDGNTLREYVTIHRGTTAGSETSVGNANMLMSGTHLGHNAAIGNDCILANNVLLAGYVRIGNRTIVGGGTVFHQFMRVGDYVMVQGLSKFGQDIPHFTLAAEYNGIAGLNVVGLKRAGFKPEERREIKAAFNLYFRHGLGRRDALEAAAKRTWGPAASSFFEFIAAAGNRGVCTMLRGSSSED